MMSMTIEDICRITGGSYVASVQGAVPVIRGMTAELDRVRQGYLFCSIQTDRYEAQKEMLLAKLRGAALVLCEVPPYNNNLPCVQVSDIVSAVQALAGAYRVTLRTKVIGVTGSAGKTTTKELRYYKTMDDLFRSGDQIVQKGDTVLLKASRAMRFERLVPYIRSLDR